MKKSRTHITMVLDRSGSMESIRDDVVGGVNHFLRQQAKRIPDATFTLVQFDTEDPFEVLVRFTPVARVAPIDREAFQPRGGTPLLDAIGQAIDNLDSWLLEAPAAQRPDKIVVVVVTDGQENSSRAYSHAEITDMMEDKKKAGWQFVFLSSDLRAVAHARLNGFNPAATMHYRPTHDGIVHMFRSTADRVCAFAAAEAPSVTFTEEDRSKQASPTAKP